MTISLSVPEQIDLKPRITVFGVGGAGGNAVNNMIESRLEGVEFVVANTDAQALAGSKATRKIQLGGAITQGLGAGSKPEIGRAAAEETLDHITESFAGSHMVFITAGMGGGTGTGAAPVVARAARERGMLTVGVVTKPFQFEGSHRASVAERGIAELQQYVDTLIIIPNQNLFRLANEKTTFAQAFAMADNVLHSGVRGVTDLMIMPGLINLDFADVRTVMSEMGKAMMGTGEASGEKRAIDAAEAAISNPLLDDVSMKGARGVLINITGGMDLTLFEVDEAANRIRQEVDPDANIIVGSTFDPDMEGRMRVSVVATGIEAPAAQMPKPSPATVAPFVRPQQMPAGAAPAPRQAQAGAPSPAAAAAMAPQPVQAQSEPAQPAAAEAFAQAPIELVPAPRAEEPVELTQIAPAVQPPVPVRSALSAGTPVREPEAAPRRGLLEKLAKNMLGMRGAPVAPPQQQVHLRGHVEPHAAFAGPQTAPPPAEQPAAPAPQSYAAPPQPVRAPQQTVAPGLEPSPRGLDDQLEIPAFLRRQAN